MKFLLLTFVLALRLLSGPALPAQPSAHPAATSQPNTADAAPATPAAETTFSLLSDREPVASLAGQWLFQPGDDPRWAAPGFDDSHWALVRSDADWDEIGYRHLDGTAWYRFRVTLPAGDQPFSLHLPAITTCYQVFADGQLLRTEGAMPPHPSLFRTRPTLVQLPAQARAQPQTILVALRIWHDPVWSQYRSGGLQGGAFVGRSDLLTRQFSNQQQAHLWQFSDDIDLAALELLAFGVALVLFLARSSEREFLWFAVMTFGGGMVHVLTAWSRLRPSSVYIFDTLNNLMAVAFLAGMLLFLNALLRGRWSNGLVFALSCCGLTTIILPVNASGTISVAVANGLGLLLTLPIYGWMLVFVHRRTRKGQTDARILRGPLTFLLLTMAYMNLLGTLQTFGLPQLGALEPTWRHPFFFNLSDVAEVIFLAAVLTIVLRRFALRSREQDRVASELDAARSVQQVLVPESLPGVAGLAIGTAYHPAQQVGGDFFQILPLRSGATLIVIGDVAGKGLPAALQVSLVVGTLRALAESTSSPASILAGLNRSLQGRGPGFTTCLALSIAADAGALTFANAGHIAPYVNGFELRTEPNLPLGLVPEIDFDEIRYPLNVGDHLTVMTDGVPEATHQRELFGFERTGQISRESAAEIAAAAQRFGQADDITVLTVDILPATARHTEQLPPALQPA